MADKLNSTTRIPVILVDQSAVDCAGIFNVNEWEDKSKLILMSCWTEYSVLAFCTKEIIEICNDSSNFCSSAIKDIQAQWNMKNFEIDKVDVLVQVPKLHLRIESFFSSIKSLLDLLVQLISSHGIVNAELDGFHRKGGTYGGVVLNALSNNAPSNHKLIAKNLIQLFQNNKDGWIDNVIQVRDNLVHPSKGSHQIMFQLDLANEDGNLNVKKIFPPQIDNVGIDVYAKEKLEKIRDFSMKFLNLIKDKDSA